MPRFKADTKNGKLLVALLQHDDGAPSDQLAEEIGIIRKDASKLLTKLRDRDLLETTTGILSSGKQHYRLTGKGREVAEGLAITKPSTRG